MSEERSAITKKIYKISGMDCAEEIAILKREVGPLVGGDDKLSFDLLNAKMIVESPTPFADDDVIRTIVRTGMGARLWSPTEKLEPLSFWSKRGRHIMTMASGVSLSLAFTIHVISHGIGDALSPEGDDTHTFPAISIFLYLVSVICGAWFIFPKALFSLRSLRPDMNLLMTIAVAGAIGIGEYFEAATVAFLFAVALLLESWSVGRARRAIAALMDLSPQIARCVEGDAVIEKAAAEVPVGTRIQVRPGERIPLDGRILKGSTTVNQAPITGESIPVSKETGSEVYAGSINDSGAFEFESTKPANDTTLARIIHMVEEAQSRRAPSEQWVETFARYYTPAMMLLALLVALLPPLLLSQPWDGWVYKSLVLLVVACPCALVISTPVSIVAGLSAAARAGILIKGGTYLEAPSKLRVIAMDKTGTLTKGQPEVQRLVAINGHSESELLERAASLEVHSEHPLARAILRRAEAEGIKAPPAENFRAVKGKGAEATIDGDLFWIGSHRFLHEKSDEPESVHQEAMRLEADGHTVVVIGNEQHIWGFISIADQVRPESRDALAQLKAVGIEKVVMLTGDNEGTARSVGSQTGVDDIRFELLPEDKVEAIRQLVQEYGAVAMVGDGVNDAPAMATASLGIAMGAVGTDAALETADIALMSDDLSRLPWLIGHSQRTLRIIKQNIFFALAIKVIFIVLSLSGNASLWMAIAADMGASLLVIANGLRLLR
jgi:Cd2+/Zn2+-exporting ATPase